MRRLSLLLAACLLAAPAAAHDTWFEPLPDGRLALGTGNRWPLLETAVGREFLERQGCRAQGPGSERTMQPLHHTEHALVLQPKPAATTCWAQLVPLDIELTPPLVEVYLREVQAPAAVREAWARQRAAGLTWRERYVKHARIELAGDATPAPMAMDLVRSPTAQGGHRFQVLRDGRPLAGQALELIAADQQMGVWRRSDAQGHVTFPALPAGRWVLRGTQLTLADDGAWHSHFVTLAFDVPGVPAPAPAALSGAGRVTASAAQTPRPVRPE
jgi:hypothetical protein